MAMSFKDSLEAQNSLAATPAVMSLSDEELSEENWVVSDQYKWYESYYDDSYSLVDTQKNIKIDQNQVNLTQEENSQVIPFLLNRYWDGIDLMQMKIRINFTNAEGNGAFSFPVNVMYSDTKIKFYFLVPAEATVVKGKLKMEIYAYGTNEKGETYKWRTKPNEELNILESLEGNGIIEPGEGWDSYLEQVDAKVVQAQTAASEAKTAAENAQSALSTIDSKISDVSATITDNVKASMADELAKYYTKEEVDNLLANMDFTDLITEIQGKIDAVDGLANFNSTYDEATGEITFYNGEEIMTSHTLATNPTAEWTSAFKTSLKTDIDSAVTPVQEALNTYKTENDEKISEVQNSITSLQESVYTKSETDELLGQKASSSDVTNLQTKVNQVESTANANKTNITALGSKVSEIEETVSGIGNVSAKEYDIDFSEETRQLTLYEIENDVESVKKQVIISGGGGGGSTTSTTIRIDRITESPFIGIKDNQVLIKYSFSSLDSSGDDTGEGTATWKIGNNVIATSIAIQGENTFDASKYVSVGTQKLTLSIEDSAGSISTKFWTIQIVDVRIESSFNDKFTYPLSPVSFDYIPYGAVDKTVHFKLDGTEIGTVTTSSSGLPMSYSIPAQTHGSHLLDAYITAAINNTTIETDHILKDIIWYDENSDVPVIGCTYQNITAKQYDSTNISYVVYDPSTENPTVTLSVDNEVVSTLTLSEAEQIWQFKSSDVGEHILTIQCRDTVKTIHITIEKLDIDVEPITANLVFDFNPSGKSNNDADRLWSNDIVAMTVSDNFDWVNGGYQLDENGDQYFCVKAGTTATINHNLFADDARRNGKEFKLIYKTTNVRRSNATFLTCEESEIGLTMNVHEAYVKSSGKSLYIPYSEEDIIEFEFNINKDTDIPIVMSYEDGTPYRPMSYTSDHSFTQTNPVPIVIGSPDCDVHIYRMKAYNASLTSRAILSNFIADARSAFEMIDRYNQNQIYDENSQLTPESVADAHPDVKVIKLDCPHFTNDKKDLVLNTNFEFIHRNGDPVYDNYIIKNACHSGQGTTSNEYGAAGRNLELIFCFDGIYTNKRIPYDENYKSILILGDGTKYEDGTGKITLTRNSVPTNYLNLKVNIASSECENNAIMQKRYNDYLPYKMPAQKRDSRVKNSMEFVDCVIFVRENDPDLSTHREFQDCEWHYYALGNIGDSKKTDYSRVNDANDPNEFVVEIMDNTLPNSTFSATEEALAALDADQFDEDGTYGFRYEMAGITDEQRQNNMQVWRDFYRFVALSDTEKFKSNLKDWFIVDSALYFYLFTERFTMIDNRAKNTFWHWSKVYITQSEADSLGDEAQYYTIDDESAKINNGYRFELWAYDFDTTLGINNSGELTMTYGKEDIDYRTDGDPSSGYIFNAAESVFFCRIRDLFETELSNMYLKCESQGCWSASSVINEFDSRQAHFSEELWRVDYVRKYERTYIDGNTRFLEQMMNGRKKYQRRQFERDQEAYMATKRYGTSITSDQIMFRCNTPQEAVVAPDYTLHLTPYSDMYLSVMFGATYRKQIRAKAGQQYDIECPFSTMDDTAVLIYCASRIQSMGDISACYIHDNDFSKATKLQELIVGNPTEGYENNFLTHFVLGNNTLLEKLDIQNTPMLAESLNLSGCNNLKELYANNSGLTGVIFANGGNLQLAYLPSLTSLDAKNLNYVTTFSISDYSKMTTLVMENCSSIDALSIVKSATNLNRVRITGIDWHLNDDELLNKLLKMSGIDSKGYNSEQSVLSGKVYVPVVRQQLLTEYTKAWSDLVISYDTLIEQFPVTFKNDDGTVLEIQYVDKGGNAVDPVTRTENPINTPTKESTISTDFTYAGWDLSLTNIFAPRTITATYTESVRNYTVKYVSKNVVLQSTQAPYGTSVLYEGNTPTYTDEESAYVYHLFKGWDQSGLVTGDKTINAVYSRFEYTDGCFDGMDISEMNPIQIYALEKVSKEQELVEIKDSISFNMGTDVSFSDIEEKVIIAEKTLFTGSNYIDTGIKLLEEDSSWTLAIDYKIGTDCSTNGVLAQCYQSDGSNGFKLWNSSQTRITWGTNSTSAAGIEKRDILVLRHKKGETGIHVYKGNMPSIDVSYTSLSANRCTTKQSTLVFGCAKADDGAYENYATGTIYWCKLWYTDLGDSICKELALWTHETITSEIYGFKKYYLSDGSGQRAPMSSITSNLLANTMSLSNTTSNTGGWAESSLNLFLNTRFIKAVPIEWRQLIKQVKIPGNIGNKSSEVTTSNCYIAIPSIVAFDQSMAYEPYSYEGSTVPWFTSDSSRICMNEDLEANEYWTRSPNKEYESYMWSINADGSLSGYSYGLYEKGIRLEISF